MSVTRGDPPNLKNVRKGIYHHYIRVDNPKSLIFLSGQLARDADGNVVGAGDMAEQTRQCIRNMRTVLESAGGTLDDIVSVVVLRRTCASSSGSPMHARSSSSTSFRRAPSSK